MCFVYLCLQRMRKIKPFKLFDVTRILNPAERQRMMTCAVNRILAAESELAISKQITRASSSLIKFSLNLREIIMYYCFPVLS